MILVTGGTGLLGSFVAEELLRRGHAVRVLCRSEAAAGARIAGTEVALGELGDTDSLRRAAQGVDGIVHAACSFSDSSVDIAATRALLSAWSTGPFIFISSLDVYGFGGADIVTEDHPLCETYNDYSRGKVVCERLLEAEARRAGRSDFVALRAPYIWGPHPRARQRLVNERLSRDQPIVLPGDSPAEWQRYRDVWVDVRDLATIVAESLARPSGGPLNVLSGHFCWHDLYVELIRLTGSRSTLIHKVLDAIADDELPNKRLYAQPWRFSEKRLAKHLGSIPRRSFQVTLEDTVRVSDPGARLGRTE